MAMRQLARLAGALEVIRGTVRREITQHRQERAARNRYKRGSLKRGKSGRKVKSRKQAIAIGLSEARCKGAKVPRRNGDRTKAVRRRR